MSMLPEIQQAQQSAKGSFYMEREGRKLAEMTYSRAGDKLIIIDHTQVDDALRGMGAGKALVEQAVTWARTHQVKIMPLCPFAKSVFEKYENLRDVLN